MAIVKGLRSRELCVWALLTRINLGHCDHKIYGDEVLVQLDTQLRGVAVPDDDGKQEKLGDAGQGD